MLDREFPNYQPLATKAGWFTQEEIHGLKLLAADLEHLLDRDCNLMQQLVVSADKSAQITKSCQNNMRAVLQYQNILRQSIMRERTLEKKPVVPDSPGTVGRTQVC